MTLGQLKKMIQSLEENSGAHDDLKIKVYTQNYRLCDFDIDLEIGGFDSKDKYSNVGNPCVLVLGIKSS